MSTLHDEWQLMPKEPTFGMCTAAGLKWESAGGVGFPQIYRAMRAAAPTPPSAEPEAPEPIDAGMLVLRLREAGIINERGAMWLLNGDNMPFTLDQLVQVARIASPALPDHASMPPSAAGKDAP